MSKWVDVTDHFSEEERHYRNTYLEICEVLDEFIECSLFSAEDAPHEIYVNFGQMYGVSYANANESWEIRDRMKKEIEEEYARNGEPSDEFINRFARRYKLDITNAFFDADEMMESLLDIF